ncbi:MAG: CDP-glycerol glycerophosphotransferase family protein [Anaerovoracaceae bacterium]
MSIVINIFKICMKIVYGILKIFPTDKNKVLFLSRQSNELSLDFQLLKDQLLEQRPDVKIVAICNRMADGKDGYLKFAWSMVRSMYHLATATVCVLDAYWPTVSILNHKKALTVIQMWHALGKIKQSGYQTLGKDSGRSEKTSKLLCMHEKYDIIIAGGKAWNEFYCGSFNTTEDKLLNIGLPRIDHLINTEEQNKEAVYKIYPKLKEKTVLLYAPTFRRNMEWQWEQLLEAIDYDKYILIIKGHPNQQITCDNPAVLTCPEFKAVDLLAVADYLITDYSAIAIEGAVLNKKTYYFVSDYDEYKSKNGLNIDLFETMPGCVFRDAKDLAFALENTEYNKQALDHYREKYLPQNLGQQAETLAKVVIDKLPQRD